MMTAMKQEPISTVIELKQAKMTQGTAKSSSSATFMPVFFDHHHEFYFSHRWQ